MKWDAQLEGIEPTNVSPNKNLLTVSDEAPKQIQNVGNTINYNWKTNFVSRIFTSSLIVICAGSIELQ